MFIYISLANAIKVSGMRLPIRNAQQYQRNLYIVEKYGSKSTFSEQ